jgi:hypothetical protein
MATAYPYCMDTRLVWHWLYRILHDACLAACEDDVAVCWDNILRSFPHRKSIPTIQTLSFANEMALLGYPKSW